MRTLARISFVAALAISMTTTVRADPPWLAESRTGMVAADAHEASQIGAAILKGGGNAFDAAVATSLALAVCRPESTGLGGGGFMLAYVAAEKRFVVLDFRETAPACATAERYAALAAQQGDAWSPSIYGGNAVAVPGLLAGLAEISRRFGTRKFADLCAPAIELAERGFTIDEHYHSACDDVLNDFKRWPALQQQVGALEAEILLNGQVPTDGARLPRPQLAAALRLIAADGPDAFYKGPIGAALVAAAQAAGGGLTLDDLRAYRVNERTPLRARGFNGLDRFEIVTVPPPSSGGVTLIESLNVTSNLAGDFGPLPDIARSEFFPPMLLAGLRHGFADRARWLGDSDFAPIPVDWLISRENAIRLADRLILVRHEECGNTSLPDTAESDGPVSPAAPPDDGGTSHFCIADRFGNVVSMTETINGTFGSYVVAAPFGIILNNEMDDFTTVAGQANLYGLTQSSANLVAPGKRPLSSMTPTIIFEHLDSGASRPFLAIGASGGPRIISNVLQVALHLMTGRPLAEAMTEPRLHHQWQPDELYLDRDPPNEQWRETIARLEGLGHKLSGKRRGAAVQAILFTPDGRMLGACDPKKGGRPAAP